MAAFDNATGVLYTGGGLALNPAQFAEAIVNDGVSGTLWRGVPCPCARPETRLPRIDCGVCKGVGYAYPDSGRELTMFLATGRSGSEKVSQAGMVVDGTITFTVAPCKPLAHGDLFRPDEEVHVVMERLFHGNGPNHAPQDLLASMRRNNQVPIAQTPGRAPKLLYPGVDQGCIEQVVYIGADGELVEARSGDYRVLDDGEFEWIGGKGPPLGQGWSLRYQAPATYMVQGTIPLYRQQGETVLPWRVVARRYDRVSLQDGHPE